MHIKQPHSIQAFHRTPGAQHPLAATTQDSRDSTQANNNKTIAIYKKHSKKSTKLQSPNLKHQNTPKGKTLTLQPSNQQTIALLKLLSH